MLFIVEKPDSASSESFGRPWKGGPVYIYIQIQNINMYPLYRKYTYVLCIENIHTCDIVLSFNIGQDASASFLWQMGRGNHVISLNSQTIRNSG